MATLRLCSIPECDKVVACRGWCSMHYGRWQRHGDPLAGKSYGETKKFFDIALKYEGSNCLIWPFYRNQHGYGQIWMNGRVHLVSRLVCIEINGTPPSDSHHAAHTCGNGHLGCINPRHLVWKTPAENQADRVEHGTHNRGERHGASKLKADDVRTIRFLNGLIPQHVIATHYGVSQTSISDICIGRNWHWLS